jgi:hypothetical protein
MSYEKIAGILIIAGFIIFWAGNIYSPPGIYQEPDNQVRLALVEQYQTRWVISQAGGGVGIAVIALGLLALGVHWRQEQGPWLTYLPAALNLLSVAFVSWYLYQYIVDPLTGWEGAPSNISTWISTLSMLGAGVLFGILFLRTGYPAWLGYVTIGYCALAIGAFIIFNPPSFYLISLYYFAVLAAGIVALRAGAV